MDNAIVKSAIEVLENIKSDVNRRELEFHVDWMCQKILLAPKGQQYPEVPIDLTELEIAIY